MVHRPPQKKKKQKQMCGSQEFAMHIEQRRFWQCLVGVLFTQSRVTLQDDCPWLGFHQSSPLWSYEEVITTVMQVYSLFLKFLGTSWNNQVRFSTAAKSVLGKEIPVQQLLPQSGSILILRTSEQEWQVRALVLSLVQG